MMHLISSHLSISHLLTCLGGSEEQYTVMKPEISCSLSEICMGVEVVHRHCHDELQAFPIFESLGRVIKVWLSTVPMETREPSCCLVPEAEAMVT